MKRVSNILFIACAAVFLLLIAAVTILRPAETFSYYENRSLAKKPVNDPPLVNDGTWYPAMEKFLCDSAAGRKTITKLCTAADLSLKRPVVNDVVIGDGILLPFNPYEAVDRAKLKRQAEAIGNNLKAVSDVTESVGGRYYYVSVPCQYSYCAEDYPDYLDDRAELTAASVEALTESLSARGVGYIDTGPAFDAMGKDMTLSSTVDNHFSIFGAYEAYRIVLEAMNSDGCDVPVLGKDELTFTETENYYMGSRTRKLFNLVKNTEHLWRADPVAPVEFTRTNNGNWGVPSVYHREEPWTPLLYTYYMGGDIGETVIETDRPAYPDILIYGDSFTNAMECILYLSCDTMYSLDLRHYRGTVSDYILEHEPDYVICVRSYESLLSTTYNGGR